jgi:hypothetical protein
VLVAPSSTTIALAGSIRPAAAKALLGKRFAAQNEGGFASAHRDGSFLEQIGAQLVTGRRNRPCGGRTVWDVGELNVVRHNSGGRSAKGLAGKNH